MSDRQILFNQLFACQDENQVLQVIEGNSTIFDVKNRKPLGGNYSNYGIVKNQQSREKVIKFNTDVENDYSTFILNFGGMYEPMISIGE